MKITRHLTKQQMEALTALRMAPAKAGMDCTLKFEDGTTFNGNMASKLQELGCIQIRTSVEPRITRIAEITSLGQTALDYHGKMLVARMVEDRVQARKAAPATAPTDTQKLTAVMNAAAFILGPAQAEADQRVRYRAHAMLIAGLDGHADFKPCPTCAGESSMCGHCGGNHWVAEFTPAYYRVALMCGREIVVKALTPDDAGDLAVQEHGSRVVSIEKAA